MEHPEMVPHEQLWTAFDGIRRALLKQDVMRHRPGFEAWVAKARPHFEKLTAEVAAAPYGLALCAWLDWLDKNGLAFRGELRWKIPAKGPLTFTPPSTEGLMKEIGNVLGELHLEDAVARSGRWSVAPTQKTRGARGQGTVRQLPPQK